MRSSTDKRASTDKVDGIVMGDTLLIGVGQNNNPKAATNKRAERMTAFLLTAKFVNLTFLHSVQILRQVG
ncbi:MAG: hypothetical protein DHS20C05_16730 [Hyphococcus sp.]|nr:MAG: hypothetical protein DHS20C05_16730 [Marinicaulis sp.]